MFMCWRVSITTLRWKSYLVSIKSKILVLNFLKKDISWFLRIYISTPLSPRFDIPGSQQTTRKLVFSTRKLIFRSLCCCFTKLLSLNCTLLYHVLCFHWGLPRNSFTKLGIYTYRINTTWRQSTISLSDQSVKCCFLWEIISFPYEQKTCFPVIFLEPKPRVHV